MSDEVDHGRTIPHCYRVVQLGLSLRMASVRPLAERASAEIASDGKRIRASSLFEPKVGGGGHLLLVNEETGATWARVLVEPDGSVLSLMAVILDGEWKDSDEKVASRVRAWLAALLGPSVGTLEAGTNGTASAEISEVPR